MKFLLLTALLASAIVSSPAHARDSSWVLCQNDSLVVNALEHRSVSGDSRSTTYAMIYGARILKGELPLEKQSTTLIEDARAKLPSTFKGTLIMSPDLTKVAIKGRMTLDGQAFETLDLTLDCAAKNND